MKFSLLASIYVFQGAVVFMSARSTTFIFFLVAGEGGTTDISNGMDECGLYAEFLVRVTIACVC